MLSSSSDLIVSTFFRWKCEPDLALPSDYWQGAWMLPLRMLRVRPVQKAHADVMLASGVSGLVGERALNLLLALSWTP